MSHHRYNLLKLPRAPVRFICDPLLGWLRTTVEELCSIPDSGWSKSPNHSCGLKSVAFLHRAGGGSWAEWRMWAGASPLWPASLHQGAALLSTSWSSKLAERLCVPGLVHCLLACVSEQLTKWRMPSSGMWRRVDLVKTDVSKERVASIFRVKKIHAAPHPKRWHSS
jgi:hypothetical protein